jgi:hypothetical protein
MSNWEQYCLSKEAELQKMFPSANLKNPQTLTDKLQWLKIHDSTFFKAYCADKITLRDFCKSKIGKDLCIPILAIYDKPENIVWEKLPMQFVIKCNHGSGYNIIVKNKNTVNRQKIYNTLNNWLKIKYGSLSYELYYNLIPPKIFIEQYQDFHGGSLLDYKFWCFNGEPKFFTINGDFGHGHFNHYDLNGKLLDISRTDFPADFNRKDTLPKTLQDMIRYSKILSKDFRFVRVDFYEINDKPVLGEMTFIPGSGRMKYKNQNTDLELGKLLNL